MKDAILTFGRAVFWGSIAGGGPFTLLTVPVALEASGGWQFEGVWFVFLPVVIAAVAVTLAIVIFGLPLTIWLAHRKDEDATTYIAAGLGLGVVLPIAVSGGLGGGWGLALFLAVPGAMAGTTTGVIWGRWRQSAADRFDEPAAAADL